MSKIRISGVKSKRGQTRPWKLHTPILVFFPDISRSIRLIPGRSRESRLNKANNDPFEQNVLSWPADLHEKEHNFTGMNGVTEPVCDLARIVPIPAMKAMAYNYLTSRLFIAARGKLQESRTSRISNQNCDCPGIGLAVRQEARCVLATEPIRNVFPRLGLHGPNMLAHDRLSREKIDVRWSGGIKKDGETKNSGH